MTERINAIGAIIAAQFKRIDIAMIAAAIVEERTGSTESLFMILITSDSIQETR